MFSGLTIPIGYVSILYDWTGRKTGSGKSKMVAYTPEMQISQLPDELATRFQRLYLFFWGRPCQWDMCIYRTIKLWGNRQWKIQDGSLHPWNEEISAPRRASNAIPTAIPIFFWVNHTNGTCVYTVRLTWEETGSGKSKMAAYTHEMRISQLPD